MSDTVYYDDEGVVDDWENLLDEEEEAAQKAAAAAAEEQKAADAKKTSLQAQKGPKKIVLETDMGGDEEDSEARALRQRLQEKWSDMQSVGSKNITLLHERRPVTKEERTALNKDIAALVLRQKDSKHFGSYLDVYVKTVVKNAMQGCTVPGKAGAVARVARLREILVERQKAFPSAPSAATRSIPAAAPKTVAQTNKEAKAEVAKKYNPPAGEKKVVQESVPVSTSLSSGGGVQEGRPVDGYGRTVVAQQRDVDDFM